MQDPINFKLIVLGSQGNPHNN